MKIAIATDTNCGMSPKEAQAAGIHLLPMPVIIDGETFLEGAQITHPQLYEAMAQHKSISTSQPAPGQVMALWDRLLGSGYDQVVYIPMSSGLSGSCQNARLFAEDYDGRVQVVDNHRISVTQTESARAAVRLAQQGMSAQDIRAYLEARAYDASIYISVDSLEYLKRGGRITPAVAAFATVLNLKPVLTIQGDKLDTHAKVRGMRQAEEKMLEALRADRETRFAGVPDEALQFETAGTLVDPAQAEAWRQKVEEAFGTPVHYAQLPCSIACHVGPNAIGIGVIRKSVV